MIPQRTSQGDYLIFPIVQRKSIKSKSFNIAGFICKISIVLFLISAVLMAVFGLSFVKPTGDGNYQIPEILGYVIIWSLLFFMVLMFITGFISMVIRDTAKIYDTIGQIRINKDKIIFTQNSVRHEYLLREVENFSILYSGYEGASEPDNRGYSEATYISIKDGLGNYLSFSVLNQSFDFEFYSGNHLQFRILKRLVAEWIKNGVQCNFEHSL